MEGDGMLDRWLALGLSAAGSAVRVASAWWLHPWRLVKSLAREVEQKVRGEAGKPVARRERVEEEVRRQSAEAERERSLARAAEADRRKGELIAAITHELRSPLTTIRIGLYLLDRSPPGSEVAARARESVQRQAERLARLVDDLLNVTRISAGELEQRESVGGREAAGRARDVGAGPGAESAIAVPLDRGGEAERRAAVPAAGDDRRWRVLVIDDDEDEASTLRDVLQLGGHRVEVAHGGAEGIERVRSFRPDVVLCDIGLPGMNGCEVARAVRGDPALAGARLVAVTGYSRPEDVEAVREAGFDRHLAKPVSIPDLEGVIRALSAEREAGGDAAAAREGAPPLARSTGEAPPSRGERELVSSAEMEVLVSRASHDLLAPLRHIDAFSEALLRDCGGALGEDGRSHLARIRLARRRAQEIIEDLLTLWRVTSAELATEVVDLSALARRAWAGLRQAEPWRAIEVRLEDGVTARGDPRLLRVLLENLLGNAWKYTAGRPSALVEFGRTGSPEGAAYFVRDDGVGFDMAYADKLFEPFQRLHAKAHFEGTGLGLHTVRRVVERHGGRAWIESAPERGTVVRFTLGPET
jgi:signal transduction histidine kinase